MKRKYCATFEFTVYAENKTKAMELARDIARSTREVSGCSVKHGSYYYGGKHRLVDVKRA